LDKIGLNIGLACSGNSQILLQRFVSEFPWMDSVELPDGAGDIPFPAIGRSESCLSCARGWNAKERLEFKANASDKLKFFPARAGQTGGPAGR